MALDLIKWFKALPVTVVTTKPSLAGKFVLFEQAGMNLGAPTYRVISRRGGFKIGYIELRNQWRDWSVKFDGDVPLNGEILAEVYSFMRRPENQVVRRGKWRAAIRDWMLRWL